ncbi:UvrD-helicase domain-containing protein [Ornithinimicrobium cerasi]|uniref:DNA 3'-5' helicase n=1 Tax=Ornithinimicrobium cerasi TaxID=2248773 RepID=A0A285VJI4_9MICO|nr:UvrD-helicase domain-containing protein [Ornithinimicrobium cerasi]SOC53708.1 ATP-dependent exoDNAse (exonuclease V) beta subunit (contains helicase and exonuclease domains) [Ornithinimicrobium cerasi]
MTQLTDEAARRRIRERTDETLFVEAGAGSGKTKSLVDRVSTLVLRDGIPIEAVAAVTFTERAAAELRDRLRASFEQEVRAGDAVVRGRAEEALDGLDLAAIGTLHSFAQRILTEHPIEAGVPPLVEVLDEVGSSVAFEARWAELRGRLLDDDDLAPTLELALATGVKVEQVRAIVAKLNGDWDLVESHVVVPGAPDPPSLPDVEHLVERAMELASNADTCADPEDRFVGRLAKLTEWVETHQGVGTDTAAIVDSLRAAEALQWHNGRGKNWAGALEGLRADCKAWQTEVEQVLAELTDRCLRVIVHWCGERVLESAQARRREGRLEFHDLLVLARDLLASNPEVRETLQQRYRRLLLDEFQDTDPIQIEIAVRIAGGAAAAQPDWRDVAVPPGSLFVVGDPKQSIYRFRRADIKMYLQARETLGGQVSLTTNFRSGAPVLDWVNAVFDQLIVEVPDRQPAYEALAAHRGGPAVGPAVAVLGAHAHEDKPRADEVRRREAQDVAVAIRRALDEGWTTEAETDERDEDGRRRRVWRALREDDIAILVPARTSVPFLEEALDAAGVDYRTESSSIVYQAQEVRDLFAALRSIADTSDGFALVTALRSSLFGCGDDDLFTFCRDGGTFHVLTPVPDALADHPVARATAYLRGLHDEARWLTPSEVLTRLVVDRRMQEVAADGPRARDTWRRLRYVVDQARAWSETEHGGLRAYLAWAQAQASETSRAGEAVLPESDVDSVRIMTVHAAKGLQFPMVVVSGLSSKPNNRRGVQLLWKDDGFAISLGKDLTTGDFADAEPVDEQMSDLERRRLLYVATTRAQDHLVVSMHRAANGGSGTLAHLLAGVGAAELGGAVALDCMGSSGEPVPVGTARAVLPPPEWATWRAERDEAINASHRRSAISASGLEGTDPEVELTGLPTALGSTDAAEGQDVLPDDEQVAKSTAKGARDVERPAWVKGRYGSAIGRAVHGVMQTVDLATGSGLDDAVASQCWAEGVTDYAEAVRDLANSFLQSDVVRRAAEREHWRESYVAAVQEDGTLLEGFVDLLYREDDGHLVVVDYKTDEVPAEAIASRARFYAPQVFAYADLVGRAVGHSRVAAALCMSSGTVELITSEHSQAR